MNDDTEYTPFTAYPESGNVRRDELADIERRMARQSQAREAVVIRDLANRGQTVRCVTCGSTFQTMTPNVSRRCPACRTATGNATRQRGTK